jgi:hypothetical protein
MTITLFVAVALVVAATVFAAPATNGKILAVNAGSVRIAIDGEKPSWITVGAPVKFKDGVGKILEVSAEGVGARWELPPVLAHTGERFHRRSRAERTHVGHSSARRRSS